MENNNSVCFVARVEKIEPINGADLIVLATIGGWSCVVKKDAHVIGERVIVATNDAVIPENFSAELGVTSYLRNGTRVRTVKLKGVYSECLILPIDYAPHKKSYEGADLMDDLGIYKYEPPVKQIQLSSGKVVKYKENSNFPVYYKFPNLKNVSGMFTTEDVVQITRKIHGTNSRYGIVKKQKLTLLDRVKKFFGNKWVDFEYVYGSHNVEKGSDSQGFYSTDVWREVADKYNIKERLWMHFKSLTKTPDKSFIIYGEIFGPGIQKNYDYGLDEIKFCMFDVVIDDTYLKPLYTEYTAYDLSLDHVEILAEDSWSQELQDKFTFNNFIDGTKIPHEGIVIKDLDGNRKKVAKVINPDYLIYAEKKDVGDSH